MLVPDGVVEHVNEVACAILDVERAEALGRALRRSRTQPSALSPAARSRRDFLAHPEREREAIEIALFLRGRDHFYVLRPTPFRALDGTPAGLILVLQDVTYLRDQEARREQLVATLSHELRTPLTSLRMAVELLRAREPTLDRRGAQPRRTPSTRTCCGSRTWRSGSSTSSRSRAMSIALEREPVDLAELVVRVSDGSSRCRRASEAWRSRRRAPAATSR